VKSGVIPCTAGVSVLDVFKSLEDALGEETVKRGIASAPPEMRAEFEALTPIAWFPNTTLSSLIDAVAAAAGLDPEPLLDAAVRRAVERTFKTVWRMFLRFTSDEALIARTPMIYSKARNVGQLVAKVLEPGVAELTLSDWPEVTPRQIRTIGIGIEEVVRLAGRRQVALASSRSADGAIYRLTWRV
jgi:hypothetical protein